jgi:hypothetical protein
MNDGKSKNIERLINRVELKELIKGKPIIIAYFQHRYKQYELIGNARELKEVKI